MFPGCGEDELGIGRGFLKGFEEGVEGSSREHVHLVDDVDLVATGLRRDGNLAHKFADVFDTVVRSGVEFENVHGAAIGETAAAFTFAASFSVGGKVGAVDGFGQNAGTGGFADATRTAEKKGLGKLVGADGIFERGGNVLLTHDAVEGYRTIFTC